MSSHCPCIPRIFATIYLACWELWELCLWGRDAAKRVAEQRLERVKTLISRSWFPVLFSASSGRGLHPL